MAFLIHLDEEQGQQLCAHLLPLPAESEEAAFLYCRVRGAELHVSTMDLVRPDQFEQRTLHHLWLRDDVYAGVIKRAHDLDAALVEVHSHPYGFENAACFSYSDCAGLRQTAPHVLWRLTDRPFASVVIAETAFDGLVWETLASPPATVGGLMVGKSLHQPTGFSIHAWRRYDQ